MNFIHIVLIIGLWLTTIFRAYKFFEQKSLNKETKREKRKFIESLIFSIIYTLYKLGAL